jgi:hypothetical protein
MFQNLQKIARSVRLSARFSGALRASGGVNFDVLGSFGASD